MAISATTGAFARACTMVVGAIGIHALGTNSVEGLGEITLRDGLVVAAAATGAERHQAWIIEREFAPDEWNGRAIDIVVKRVVNNADKLVYSAEVKWWRDATTANAANRRRDLVGDLIRAATIYPDVEDDALVILLSTEASYRSTARGVLHEILHSGQPTGQWNLRNLKNRAAIRGAVQALRNDVKIPNVFHTELAAWVHVRARGGQVFHAYAWAVRKPQHTHWLTEQEFDEIEAG
jgi:hypothetical protein